MNNLLLILSLFNSLAFIYYGISCIYEKRMVLEFHRFGIPQYRKLIGISQVAAGSLILCTPYFPLIAFIATLGLCIQMGAGVMLRISIKDGILQSLPALFFFVLNGYLAIRLFMIL